MNELSTLVIRFLELAEQHVRVYQVQEELRLAAKVCMNTHRVGIETRYGPAPPQPKRSQKQVRDLRPGEILAHEPGHEHRGGGRGFEVKSVTNWRDTNGKVRTWNANGSDAGNVIDTSQNLALLNGATVMHRKFELLPENAPPLVQMPLVQTRVLDFGEMTLPELQQFAEAEKIDLKGAKTADEARKIIRAARKALPPS